jgi:hypothetical protein
MMAHSNPLDYSTPQKSMYTGRRVGLILSGSLLALAGLILLAVSGLSVIAIVFADQLLGSIKPRPRTQDLAMASVMYAGFAGVLLALGFGAIMCLRWCRPLILIVAKVWLVFGLFTVVGMIVSKPYLDEVYAGAGITGRTASTIQISTTVLIAIAPAVALLVFFLSPRTRLALEHFDPRRRWTDDISTALLGLVAACGLLAVFKLAMIPTGRLALANTLLEGTAGRLTLGALSVVWFYCAWLCFRRSPRGWLLTLVLVVATCVAWIVSAESGTLTEMALTNAEEHPQAVKDLMVASTGRFQSWAGGATLVLSIGYMLWLRRWFKKPGVTG